MHPWRAKLQRFGALSPADRKLLVRAAAALAVARLQVSLLPFDRLASRLFASGVPDGDAVTAPPDPELIGRIAFAVRAAAANVPWRANCLPQALAANALLTRHGYAPVLHLGVERHGDDVLDGHAWLTCGEAIVIGGETRDRYTEVHRYGPTGGLPRPQ